MWSPDPERRRIQERRRIVPIRARGCNPDPGTQGPPGGRTGSPGGRRLRRRRPSFAERSVEAIGSAIPRSKGTRPRPPVGVEYEKSLCPSPPRIPFSLRADNTLAAVPPPSGRGGRRGRRRRKADVCGIAVEALGSAIPRSKGARPRLPVGVEYEKSLCPSPQMIPFSFRAVSIRSSRISMLPFMSDRSPRTSPVVSPSWNRSP